MLAKIFIAEHSPLLVLNQLDWFIIVFHRCHSSAESSISLLHQASFIISCRYSIIDVPLALVLAILPSNISFSKSLCCKFISIKLHSFLFSYAYSVLGIFWSYSSHDCLIRNSVNPSHHHHSSVASHL